MWRTPRWNSLLQSALIVLLLPMTANGVQAPAGVVTEYVRNAPAWISAEPRYVGYAFDYWWPSPGNAFGGCVVDQGDPTAPRTLDLIGGTMTVTSRNAAGDNVCPFFDGTSLDRTSDVYLESGGEVTFEFSPPISAFYTNYGSLAAGETCTMRLYSGGSLVDSLTSAVSTHSGSAAGHGFSSPVLVDEIRITCTETGIVLIGAFRGTLGDKDVLGTVCALPCPADMDFACVFEGDQITISLPALDSTEDEVILVPRGRTIYALLVSGYSQNADFDLLHFFNFAHYILKQGGYVHYSWWNNLLAPYMTKPLHDATSFPGNLFTELGGFAPTPGPDGYFAEKARPEEDKQFQSDALRFLAAVKDAEPSALLVVVGHSMGGGAVARLGSDTITHIDLLGPIDPVGNRSLPVGRVNTNQYNWTRWRAIHNEFRGYKNQDCDRNILNFCKIPRVCVPFGDWRDSPPGLLGGWLVADPICGALVHNPSARGLSHVRNLYHRWQTEAPFPLVDYDVNRYFNFSPPPGGKSVQSPVTCCDAGDDPIDASIPCKATDGHGEIVGFRHIHPNMILDGVAATNWTSSSVTRKQYLEDWETEGDAWGHKPTKPDLCLVSNGLISMLQGLITYDDAAFVVENERQAADWKNSVPNRWEAYTFDEFWPASSPASFTGCTITGQPDATAPRTLQLNGGQVTVATLDDTGNPLCPLQDRTSLARATDLVLPPGGRAIMAFDPPIGAFYALYGSLEEARNVRMDLYAGAELVDFVISPASPASANSVLAIGHGFVSPRLIDRIEFTSTETGGNVLVGALRGVLSTADSLGKICIPAYSASCATLFDFDFACVFGPGPVVNQTQPLAPFYYTLQGALDGGRDGDVIVAAPGTYNEFINFLGKAITLRGADAATDGGCMIDVTMLRGSGSAVTFASGEGPGSVLDGFTLIGGFGTFTSNARRGGGLYIDEASPTVKNCRIIDNRAMRGGGAYAVGGEPTFVNCTWAGNLADSAAGFLGVGTRASMTNCLFTDNHATSGHGGAVVIEDHSQLTMTNCTVTENSAAGSLGGGVLVDTESNLFAANSVFWNNDSGSAVVAERQIFAAHGGTAFVSHSVIQDNDPGTGSVPYGGATNGNIDLDPRFVDPFGGDFRLKPTSPCVDAGNDLDIPPDVADLDDDGDTGELTPYDLDNRPRQFDADVGTMSMVDMGAFEFSGCRGDFDGNGMVELSDHAQLVGCMDETAPVSAPCRDAFDFDSSLTIDLSDFRVFQLNYICSD